MIGKTNIKVKPNKKINYVEYIESTGTQYIDTGVLASGSSLGWKLKFAFAEIPTDNSAIIGAFTYGGANGTSLSTLTSDTRFIYQYGATTTQVNHYFGTKDTKIHTIESNIEAGVMKFDGGVQLTNCGYSAISNTTVYLFASHRQGQTYFWLEGKKRIYSCQMYENGILVRDFKPVLDKKGVACLYDEVNEEYYYNAGTGNFVAGDIIKPIQYVEYIESTGTQYIDTGVVPTNKTKWVYDYQFLSDKNYANVESAQNGCGYWSNNERFVIGYGGGQLSVAIGVNGASTVNGDTARHTFILDTPNKTGYIDDIAIPCNYTSYSTDDTICFFTRNENASTSKFIHRGRLYGSKIYENGVLIRDFRPAIKEGVYYLYDEVNKEYYYNQGTGQFIGDGWEPTQLEYIESTGTQYIDTGVIPKSTTRMILTKEITDLNNGYKDGWGSLGSQEAFICGSAIAKEYLYVSVSNSWEVTDTVLKDTNKHIFDISNEAIIVDGVKYGTGNIGNTASAGQTLYLFGLHTEYENNGVYYQLANEKIYSCQIYDGETLTRNFVPVKNSNGTYCLYDQANDKYYYNQGTGEFLGGASV
jgi:hypothetical protein